MKPRNGRGTISVKMTAQDIISMAVNVVQGRQERAP
jgi:hypothetical protein